MKYLIYWLLIFGIIYLSYLLFIIVRKKKLKLFKNNMCYKYLIKVYKLNEKKLDIKKMTHIIALINAFIIATTFIIIIQINNFYLQMITALIVLIILQLITYHIVGFILKRRDNNV